MLEFSEVSLEELVVHKVGNKLQEEGISLSKEPVKIADEEINGLLLRYFLAPFKGAESYVFHHEAGLDLHEVYTFASRIFEEPDRFYDQSVNLAKHLYEQSMHHKVKGGELYVTLLRNVVADGELVDALGLFKSETKDTFLKVNPAGENFDISSDSGIDVKKLDKGCLILNTNREDGYRVFIVDTSNRQEAAYWKTDFLQLQPRQDNYHHTQHYLNLCKSFATEHLPKEFEATRADEIDLLNKSAKYFKEKDDFDLNDFTMEVLPQADMADAFKDYKKQYQREHALEFRDEFAISEAAVKKGGKVFKSVLKLDKNFHVYIHGNRELIERGFDDAQGMNYY